MSTGIQNAINILAAELDSTGTPEIGSGPWYRQQAKAFGLSFLRTALAQGMTEPSTLDMYRKELRRKLRMVEEPAQVAQ